MLAWVLCKLLCAATSGGNAHWPFVPTPEPVPYSGDVLATLFVCPDRPNFVSTNSRVYRCAPSANAASVLRGALNDVGGTDRRSDGLPMHLPRSADAAVEQAAAIVARVARDPATVSSADLSFLDYLLSVDTSVSERLLSLDLSFFTGGLGSKDSSDAAVLEDSGELISEDMYGDLAQPSDTRQSAAFLGLHKDPQKDSESPKSAVAFLSDVFVSKNASLPPRYRIASVPRTAHSTSKRSSARAPRHSPIARHYAVKVVSCGSRAAEEALRREVRWLYVARAVPNVTRYVASFWDERTRRAYVITEWVGGPFGMSLDELARLLFAEESRPEHVERLCAVVAHDVLVALARMHALEPGESADAGGATALVHADVKLANIFVRPEIAARMRTGKRSSDHGKEAYKLAQLSLSRRPMDGIDSSTFVLGDFGNCMPIVPSLSAPRSAVCTVPFRSPEMARGEAYGPAQDVWSVGVVVFALAFGDVPYAFCERTGRRLVHEELARLRSEHALNGHIAAVRAPLVIPPGDAVTPLVRDLIMRCLTPNVSERWSARRLLDEHPIFEPFRSSTSLPTPAGPAMRLQREDDDDSSRSCSCSTCSSDVSDHRAVAKNARPGDQCDAHDRKRTRPLEPFGRDAGQMPLLSSSDLSTVLKDNVRSVASAAPPRVRVLLATLFSLGPVDALSSERDVDSASAALKTVPATQKTVHAAQTTARKESTPKKSADARKGTSERQVTVDLDALITMQPTPDALLADHGVSLVSSAAPWRILALPPCIEAAYLLDDHVGGEMLAQLPSGFLDAVVMALDGRAVLAAMGRSTERMAALEGAAARVTEFVSRHWMPARLNVAERSGEADRGACALFCYAAFTLHPRWAEGVRAAGHVPGVTAVELAAAVVRSSNSVELGPALPPMATLRVPGAAPGGSLAVSQCVVEIFGGLSHLRQRIAAEVQRRGPVRHVDEQPIMSTGLDALGGVRIDRRPDALVHAPGGVFRAIEQVSSRGCMSDSDSSSSTD